MSGYVRNRGVAGGYSPYDLQNAQNELTNLQTAAQRDDGNSPTAEEFAAAQAKVDEAYSQLTTAYAAVPLPAGSAIAAVVGSALQFLKPSSIVVDAPKAAKGALPTPGVIDSGMSDSGWLPPLLSNTFFGIPVWMLAAGGAALLLFGDKK